MLQDSAAPQPWGWAEKWVHETFVLNPWSLWWCLSWKRICAEEVKALEEIILGQRGGPETPLQVSFHGERSHTKEETQR